MFIIDPVVFLLRDMINFTHYNYTNILYTIFNL